MIALTQYDVLGYMAALLGVDIVDMAKKALSNDNPPTPKDFTIAMYTECLRKGRERFDNGEPDIEVLLELLVDVIKEVKRVPDDLTSVGAVLNAVNELRST